MEDSYEEVARQFLPLYQTLQAGDATEARPLLAHYTGVEALEQILKNDEIWFSNPLFMNDWEEIRFGIYEGAALFRTSTNISRAAESPERERLVRRYFEGLLSKFEEQDAFDIYVLCFSEHSSQNSDGLLSMWRGYGGHGRGAALIFNTAKAAPMEGSPLIIAKVEYGSIETRRAILAGVIDKWCELLQTSNISDSGLFYAVYLLFEAIKLFSLVTKHDGFAEECEWRIVYMRRLNNNSPLDAFQGYVLGKNGIEPKLKFKIAPLSGVAGPDITFDNLLDQIILGPSISSNLSRKGFERMLEHIDKGHLRSKFYTSTIPLRPK